VRHIVVLLMLCGLTGLLWTVPAKVIAADDLAGSQQELGAVRQQIETTLRDLRSKQAQAGDLSSDLEKLEDALNRLRALIRRSDRELARLDRQLADTQSSYEQLLRQQDETELQLKTRLVALYKVGQNGVARSLFSTAGTPLELAEKYAFLSRIARHDRSLMAEYRRQGVVAAEKLAELQFLREQQTAQREQQRAERAALDAAGAAKKDVLAKVRAEEQRLAKELSDLRAKAARLAELVKRLESAKTPSYTGKAGSFSAQKGRLPWPVSGRVRLGFGPNRHPELGTKIESNGLEIEAVPQSEVKALWSGRVLYAGPLKGFGNLIVIDHGEKYYSLYGHVANFTRKVGDDVKPQELIAFSGHDGRDAVYFELRHRGAPVDPAGWLAPR